MRFISIGALATALAGLSSVATATPADPIERARRAGSIDSAHAEYYRALAALAPDRLPPEYRSTRTAPAQEVSLTLRNAFLSSPRLLPEEQDSLKKLLARPTDLDDDYAYSVAEAAPVCTENFCIHYVTTTSDAPPLFDGEQNGTPDVVENLGVTLESARAALIALGYSYHGIDDEGVGGDTRLDVYIADAGQDFAAAVVPEDFKSFSPLRMSSYMIVNTSSFTDLPPDYLESVVPHELKHTFDAATFGNAPAWLFESSAIWVENEVLDSSNAHTLFFPCWYLWPEFSLDVTRDTPYPSDPRDFGQCAGAPYHIYGSGTFWFHASVVVGVDLNRNVWEQGGEACASEVEFEGAAVRRCVADTIMNVIETSGHDFADVYADFTRKNYRPRKSSVLLQSETPGELFAWPNDVYVEKKVAKYPATGEGVMSHWSARYFELSPPSPPGPTQGTLTVEVDGPDDVASTSLRAALILTQAGDLKEVPIALDPVTGVGTGEVTGFGEETSLVALVVTNVSPIEENGSSDEHEFSWTASFEPSTAGTGGSGGAPSGGAGGIAGSGGSGGAPQASPESSDDDSGCGCRVPSGTPSDAATWVGLVALGALFARRRR